ncbi:MAG: hypothetical protein R2865_12445 [Deinococcales bacterium]
MSNVPSARQSLNGWIAKFSGNQPAATALSVPLENRLWTNLKSSPDAMWQEHTQAVQSLSFSRDGRYLATGSDDESIIIWDVLQSRAIQRLNKHQSFVSDLAFSPEGTQISLGCARW